MAAALLMAPAAWAAAPPDAIVGVWLTEDGSSRVTIAAVEGSSGGAGYAGKITWLKEPAKDGKPLTDANNADAALRARPILGLTILDGFKPQPAGGWSGGTIYSPRAGKTYPAELSLAADGRLQIKVQAGIVSRTIAWTR